MPRGRPARQPSARNFQLYHELVCGGCLQAEVAVRFRLSQPRVAQILSQVEHWIACLLPLPVATCFPAVPGLGETARQFHLAIALRRLQLNQAYGQYLAHFVGVQGAAAYGQLLAACDAGLLPPDVLAKLPRRDLVKLAVRMARELNDLAAIAERGPFFDLANILDQIAAVVMKARSEELRNPQSPAECSQSA